MSSAAGYSFDGKDRFGSQSLTRTSGPSQGAVPADTPVTAVAAPSAEAINTVPLTEDERRKLRAQRFGGSVGGPLGKVTARHGFFAGAQQLIRSLEGGAAICSSSFSSVTASCLLLAIHKFCGRGQVILGAC